MTCPHNHKVGDNYGLSCYDCGEKLEGYGNWGAGGGPCIHRWLPDGSDGEVCVYCERWRQKPQALGKVIKTMPDPRILRIEQIEEALDHPERLNETEWQELTREMLEIDRDLKDNPPSEKDLYQQWEEAEKEYHRNPTIENRSRVWKLWKARHPNASPYHFG